ncbi:putative leucine-rich repeat-containing protein DDB_G0290503 [Drosophila suzukii]|uniref:Leucine-rich repeat-containing protein DDB_G0290503 n=1 Tax=Drosophila suzukii TaxID=28584 RepID=A0AB39ZXR6_DROSZ
MGGRSRTLQLVFLALIALGQWHSIAAGPVTNEELRGTIQSLIYSYNQLDNKLERHEHRERALGELLKKALQSLQKGQKSLEPINGIFGRLDERVSQIETMLITQEEKYNAQSDRFNQATDHMFKWMRENDECFKRPPVSANLIAPPAAPAAPAIPKEFLEEQRRFNAKLLEEIQNLKASNQKAADQTQKSFESLPKGPELLSQIEAKLQEHSASVTTAAPPKNNEFEAQLLERLNSLGGKVTELSETVQRPAAPVGLNENDRAYIQELNNDTLNALAELRTESSAIQKSAATETTERLQQTEANIQADVRQLSTDVGILNKYFASTNESNAKLNEGLEALSKFNNIMMTNSQVVLDTQRKVDFGTLNVVQRVGKLLEEEMTKLSELLKERFASLDGTVVNTQQEANKNISALLETELNQVWHRIEIMAGEISQSREMLGVIQSASDGYINSTLATMMGLGSKVQETKKHMIDMDENLNFLLGKLALMSSEFANIKKGLAESLEDLRNSFHVLHERMPTGPGPHNIDKNKYLTDVNLLSKRHAEPERE